MNNLAGTWWEKDGKRIVVIGNRRNGSFVVENECGTIEIIHGFLVDNGWKILPGCTGFNWVEVEPVKPEEFPQYWTTIDSPSSNIAYLIRTGPDEWGDCIQVMKDGTKQPISGCRWNTVGRRKMTKDQAEALETEKKPAAPEPTKTKTIEVSPGDGWRWLDDEELVVNGDEFFDCSDAKFFDVSISIGKPAKLMREQGNPIRRKEDVESPHDWVTQDRVSPRPDIDQFTWTSWKNGEWQYVKEGFLRAFRNVFHGWKDPHDGTVVSIRCRREDLPQFTKSAPKTSSITFHEVIRPTDLKTPEYEIIWTSDPASYDDRTGNIRTIDIPSV